MYCLSYRLAKIVCLTIENLIEVLSQNRIEINARKGKEIQHDKGILLSLIHLAKLISTVTIKFIPSVTKFKNGNAS